MTIVSKIGFLSSLQFSLYYSKQGDINGILPKFNLNKFFHFHTLSCQSAIKLRAFVIVFI